MTALSTSNMAVAPQEANTDERSAMKDWYPFLLVAGGGTAWTLLYIAVAQRYEKHDGPLSFAILPVLLGFAILVLTAEALWG